MDLLYEEDMSDLDLGECEDFDFVSFDSVYDYLDD